MALLSPACIASVVFRTLNVSLFVVAQPSERPLSCVVL